MKVTSLQIVFSTGIALGGGSRDKFTGLEGHLPLQSHLGGGVLQAGLAPALFLWGPCSLFHKLPFGYVYLSVFRFLKL